MDPSHAVENEETEVKSCARPSDTSTSGIDDRLQSSFAIGSKVNSDLRPRVNASRA